jgi:NodT family efflux transporter outer membrane factor (OMF) lipoprotein
MLLASCATVGPSYVAQPPATPTAWQGDPNSSIPNAPASASLDRWWESFHDATLNKLVDDAERSNLDIAAALARVDEARASRKAVASQLSPQIGISEQGERELASRHTFPGAILPNRGYSLFDAGPDLSWELDLFGGVHRQIQGAEVQIGSAQASADAVRLAVASEVARQYVGLRGLQARQAVAQSSLASARQLSWLVAERQRGGLATELEVERANAQAEAAASALPPLDAAALAYEHGLAVLTGRQPEALVASLSEAGPIPTAPDAIPVGLPSDLILRRPDLRAAERQLAAATDAVGATKAAGLPHFALTDSGGLASTALRTFLAGPSFLFSAVESLTASLFDGGRNRAEVREAKARVLEAQDAYSEASLVALREVEDVLVASQEDHKLVTDTAQQAESTTRALSLAREGYKGGLADLTTVLDAERANDAAQDQLTQARLAASSDAVALYRALGGGFAST